MGTKVSAATALLPVNVATGDYVPVDDGVSKQKIDLSLLVPAAIDLSNAGAGGIKAIYIDPVFPGVGNDAKYSVLVGQAAGGTPDEAINLGYNVGVSTAGEPTSVFVQEINYPATARGVAAQRTMEIYQQFSNEDTNAPRNFFTAFEPGDTTSVSGETGQILYSYIATGFTRTGTSGGGGLRIGMDFNGSAGGGGGLNTLGYFFCDVDGPRAVVLRSCQDIQLLTAATAANPCVITVATGHGFNIGARIQIFKPDANGMMTRDWNAGAAVVGFVTVATATQLTLAGVNNTSIGITNGYGWQLARPTADAAAPAFQYLSVGTAYTSAVDFTLGVAGSVGCVGTFKIGTAEYATANSGIASGDFFGSPLAFRGTDATAGGRRQMISGYTGTGTGFSIGFPDDATGDNLDNFLFGVGMPQATDSNFTVLKTALACFINNTNNESLVGVGGISPYNRAKLVIAAGTTTHAQIGLASGTAKTTPVVGDITYDGTTFRGCTTAGVWNDLASGAATTGAQTATFVATNKPGSGTAGPTGWLPYKAGATTYYIPLFGA